MKPIFFEFIVFISLSKADDLFRGGWIAIPGYSLWELYQNGGMDQKEKKRETNVVSTSAVSWPDGRQALITYIEVKQDGKKWLYRYIDNFDKNMQATGQMCYELREKLK